MEVEQHRNENLFHLLSLYIDKKSIQGKVWFEYIWNFDSFPLSIVRVYFVEEDLQFFKKGSPKIDLEKSIFKWTFFFNV